jgi:polysaccharide pyruvyl transferase WcaK-like protein
MKTWAITGFYGQDNFGDDLFCFVIANLMKKHGQRYFLQNGFVKCRADLSKSALPFARIFNKQRGVLGAVHRLMSVVFSMIRADCFVFGGGSLFGRYASYKQRRFASLMASILNRKLFAFCVSLGPFRSPAEESKYSAVLKKFDLVVTRDTASHKVAKRMSLNRSDAVDMVFAIQTIHEKKVPTEKKIVLALHRLALVDEFLVQSSWLEAFDKVVILHLDDEAETIGARLYEGLSKSLSGKLSMRSYKAMNLEDVLDEISSASFVITSKLHGAVTAAAYGVPFSLFEYQEKCTEFLVTLGGFDGYLNFGDESVFIRLTPQIFEKMIQPNWDLQRKSDLVRASFEEMINAS